MHLGAVCQSLATRTRMCSFALSNPGSPTRSNPYVLRCLAASAAPISNHIRRIRIATTSKQRVKNTDLDGRPCDATSACKTHRRWHCQTRTTISDALLSLVPAEGVAPVGHERLESFWHGLPFLEADPSVLARTVLTGSVGAIRLHNVSIVRCERRNGVATILPAVLIP